MKVNLVRFFNNTLLIHYQLNPSTLHSDLSVFNVRSLLAKERNLAVFIFLSFLGLCEIRHITDRYLLLLSISMHHMHLFSIQMSL